MTIQEMAGKSVNLVELLNAPEDLLPVIER